MDAAETRELGVLQPRNGAEDAGLLAVAQLGLRITSYNVCYTKLLRVYSVDYQGI